MGFKGSWVRIPPSRPFPLVTASNSPGVAHSPGRDYVRGTRIELLGRLVLGFRSRWDPDGIAARKREIALALPGIPCVHGVAGAWVRPLACPECAALIEASRKAAEARARAALEAQFVREVREELGRREAVRRSRPAREARSDGSSC